MNQPLYIVSQVDGEKFEVTEGIIKLSGPLMTQLEAVEDEDEPEPLQVGAKGSTLKRFFEWARRHVSDNGREPANLVRVSHPLKGETYEANSISKEDKEWVESLDMETELLDLINLANDLAIEPLLGLLCMRVSLWFRGKTPRDIQDIFGLDDSSILSPEDVQRHCDTHAWAEKLTVGTVADDEDDDLDSGVAGGAGGAATATPTEGS